jgi:hypothetical protein
MAVTPDEERDHYAEGWSAGVAHALAQVAQRQGMPAREAATSVALDVARERDRLAGLPTSWRGLGLDMRHRAGGRS